MCLRDRDIFAWFFQVNVHAFQALYWERHRMSRDTDSAHTYGQWHHFHPSHMYQQPPRQRSCNTTKPRVSASLNMAVPHLGLEGCEGQAEVQPWPWLLSPNGHKAWPRDDECAVLPFWDVWAVLSFTGCKTTSTCSRNPYNFGEAETPSLDIGKSNSSWSRIGGFGF